MPTYATWNPADKAAGCVLSNGNLTATQPAATSWGGVRSTIGVSSGKHYWEVTLDDIGGTRSFMFAVANLSWSLDSDPLDDDNLWVCEGSLGQKECAGGGVFAYQNHQGANTDIYMIALDLDNGKVWIGFNGTWPNAGDPAAGTNEMCSSVSGTLYAGQMLQRSSHQVTANFGASAFTYPVPSGFNSGLYEVEDVDVVSDPLVAASTLSAVPMTILTAAPFISPSILSADVFSGDFVVAEPFAAISSLSANIQNQILAQELSATGSLSAAAVYVHVVAATPFSAVAAMSSANSVNIGADPFSAASSMDADLQSLINAVFTAAATLSVTPMTIVVAEAFAATASISISAAKASLAAMLSFVLGIELRSTLSLVNSISLSLEDTLGLINDIQAALSNNLTLKMGIDQRTKFESTLGILNHILDADSGRTYGDFIWDKTHGIDTS